MPREEDDVEIIRPRFDNLGKVLIADFNRLAIDHRPAP
jgi:hypothetical protein